MITILHEQRVTTHQPVCGTDTTIDANDDAAALWLDAPGIEAATGWQWKPEGLCQGDICMPLPPAARARWVRELPGQPPALNLAAMWRYSGQPVVHDQAGQTWVLGTGAAQRRTAWPTTAGARSSWPLGPVGEAAGLTCPCGKCWQKN